MASDKIAALQEMVNGLSTKQMEQLRDLLEQSDDLNEEDALVLSLLRPAMIGKAGREFRDKVIQAFCDPFEDLLDDEDPNVKRPALISRKSIRPVWDWLRKQGGEEFSRLTVQYEEALDFEGEEEVAKAGQRLWRAALRLAEQPMEQAVSDKDDWKDLAEELGGTRRLEDMQEMMALLAIGEDILLQRAALLPKPVLKLSHDQVTLILNGYRKVASEQPGHESWMVVAAMRSLLHEADILTVVKSLSRDGQDTLASMTDLSIIGDEVMKDLERYAEQMEGACEIEGGAVEIVKLTQEFTTSYLSIVDSLDIKREGVWGQRLLATKKRVSQAIDRGVLQSARTDVFKALKSRKVQIGRTTRSQADLRQDPDMEAYDLAEERAKAVREISQLGERIGVNAQIQSVTKGIIEEIHNFSDSLLEQLETVPEEYVDRARSHVIMIAHLMELLAGPDPAETFYKRAFRRITDAGKKAIANE